MQSGLLLLVDADRRVQRGVARAGEEAGMEVVCCESARDAINTCCALEPAVIVCELELSDNDGLWFIATLREQPSEAGVTPIIVATHESDPALRARILGAGADVFLPKPIDPVDLVAQAHALGRMTERVRERKTITPAMLQVAGSSGPLSTRLPGSGSFERFPPATVLFALEQSRRTCQLTLTPRDGQGPPTEIDLVSGVVVEGRISGRTLEPLAAVRAALALTEGEFSIDAAPERQAPPDASSMGRLVSTIALDSGPRSRRQRATSNSMPPVESDQRPTMRPPSDVPTKPPPAKASRAPGRPSKTPRASTVRPPPVKVPPSRVPVFGAGSSKASLTNPLMPPDPAAPRAISAVGPRPAALAHSSAARPSGVGARVDGAKPAVALPRASAPSIVEAPSAKAAPPAQAVTPPQSKAAPPPAQAVAPPQSKAAPPPSQAVVPPSRAAAPPPSQAVAPPSRAAAPPPSQAVVPPSRAAAPPPSQAIAPPSRAAAPPPSQGIAPTPSRAAAPPASQAAAPPPRAAAPPASQAAAPPPRAAAPPLPKAVAPPLKAAAVPPKPAPLPPKPAPPPARPGAPPPKPAAPPLKAAASKPIIPPSERTTRPPPLDEDDIVEAENDG